MDNIVQNSMSLLMPIHGKAPFLSAAIESVYRSKNVNIEFIAILDRCENTEIWENVELCPPNVEVKVIISNNPGIVPALNLGIENAKHELIARLDSDDLASSERFISQIEFMNTYPHVVCVGTQMIFIDEDGHEFGHTNYPTKHDNIMSRMKYQNCIGHPSVMFKKTAVQEIGSYRQVLSGSEDYDLWLRLGQKGNLANLTQRFTYYRKSEFQVTNQLESIQPITENASRIFAAMRQLDISEELPEEQSTLKEQNTLNISKIRLLEPKTADELISAEILNKAYRERSINSSCIGLIKVARNLVLAGWFSPKLLLNFLYGHMRFRAVRYNTKLGLK